MKTETTGNDYSLKRNKILKSKKDIDELFDKSLSYSSFPLRIVFSLDSNSNEFKVSFSVSKKKFKKAVDRNRIKRLLKEAFRIQQHDLKTGGIKMMWMYSGKEMPDFDIIEKSMKKIIAKLNSEYGST
jgi:ribonuclease P protein component